MYRGISVSIGIVLPIIILLLSGVLAFAVNEIAFWGIGIAAAAFAIFNVMLLVKDVNKLNRAVSELAEGSLNANIPTASGSLSEMSESLKNLQCTVHNSLDTIQHLAYESVRGKLTIRSESKHGGDFGKAINAVNEIIEAMHMCYKNMRHPMQVLDKNARCTYINPTIVSYGFSPNDIGKTMAQMYSQELHDKYITCFKEISATQKPYLMHTETETEQGLIVEENYIWPIFSNGEIVAYGNITLDVTTGIRNKEVADKIIGYQDNEANAVIAALENRRKGGLRFDYNPAEYDEDTYSSYKSFIQIRDMVSFSVGATKSYVDDIVEVLQRMASNEFDFTMEKEYVGDFAPIKESIHTMISGVTKLIHSIQKASMLVEASSNEIAGEEAEMAKSFENQVATIENITAIVNELSEKSRQNAASAHEVEQLSMLVKQTAADGNASMQNLGNAMEEIKKSSTEISKVAKLLEDIAFQISLLSINASIEASHAGSAGAGFAVVAEEVRRLAERSTASAKETAEMVNLSIVNIEKGYKLTAQTAQVLAEISDISMRELDGLMKIAAQSDAQVQDMDVVSTSMKEISDMIHSDVAGVNQNAQACKSLADLAVQLGERISQFKVIGAAIRPRVALTNDVASARGLGIIRNISGKKQTYEPGDFIVREGVNDSKSMYCILSGAVDVYKFYGKSNEQFLNTLGKGAILGEISLFLDEPRTATVIVRERAIIMEVTRGNMYDLMDSNPDVAYAITETLCTRLKNTLGILG